MPTTNNTTANVSVGKPKVTGAVFWAPNGTTVPTDATTALASSFKCLGYVSEDGLTNTNSPETEEIKAWGGDVVLNPFTGKTDTFKFKLIETLNVDVMTAVYGSANITGSALASGVKISANATDIADAVWVYETILTGGVCKRIVVPSGKITEIGDIVYKDNEAVGYDLTVTAHPDSAGNTHYEYLKKGSS